MHRKLRDQRTHPASGVDTGEDLPAAPRRQGMEAVGNVTGNPRTRDEGRSDQAKSNLKNAGAWSTTPSRSS
jgi:hypothetical protein